MPLQPDQRDPQHDLARAGRPAEPLFRRLQPLEKAADAQRHVAKAGAEVGERAGHAVARRLRPVAAAARYRAARAIGAGGEEPVPVLRHAGAELRHLEILAQPLRRFHEGARQERPAVLVGPPRQHLDRAFGKVHPRPARRLSRPGGEIGLRHVAVLAREARGCLRQADPGGRPQHPPQRRAPGGRQPVERDAPGAHRRDPVLEREGLRHGAVERGKPAVAVYHRRTVHVGGHDQRGVGFRQPAQDAPCLAVERGGIGKRGSGTEAGGHRRWILVLSVGTDGMACRGQRRQRLVHQGVVTPRLAAPHPAQHRGRVRAHAPGQFPQGQPGLDMVEVERMRHGQPGGPSAPGHR